MAANVSTISLNSYIMDSENQVEEIRKGGRFNAMKILTYTDGSEWIFLNDYERERFCGFLFLENALKEAGLTKLRAAPNKMAIHNREIIYLSEYCGETKPKFLEDGTHTQIFALRDIGFTDVTGGANLRKIGDVIYVFDTAKNSFDESVHEKIDAFAEQHDMIRSILEESLKNQE